MSFSTPSPSGKRRFPIGKYQHAKKIRSELQLDMKAEKNKELKTVTEELEELTKQLNANKNKVLRRKRKVRYR